MYSTKKHRACLLYFLFQITTEKIPKQTNIIKQKKNKPMKTKNKFETKNDKYETALTNKSRKEQRFRIGNYSSGSRCRLQ